MKTYYQTLEVDEDATEDEIKTAWKKQSMKYHPDREQNPEKKVEAESKQQEINEAYAVLSDPEKRKQYDEYGTVEGNQITPSGIIKNAFKVLLGTDFSLDRMFIAVHRGTIAVIESYEASLDEANRMISEYDKKIKQLNKVIKVKAQGKGQSILREAVNEEIEVYEFEKRRINIKKIKHTIDIHKQAFDQLKEHYPREKEEEKEESFSDFNRLIQKNIYQHFSRREW
jgi:curved DNA-binding protein CbpA